MNRKEFQYKLLDGQEYIFSERNREDINYMVFQDKVRKHKIKFAEENVSDEALRDAIIIQQMDKQYDEYSVSEYINSRPEEIKELVYASFKIKNNLSKEEFDKLIDDKLCNKLIELINKLEAPEPITDGDIKILTTITEPILNYIKMNQPDAYEALKRSVKKKQGKALVQK